MTEPITPIFLFSLPRSGSTLTQRILATHPAIATAGEPWILVPLLYLRRRYGTYAEYDYRVLHTAIDEFCDGLPGGEADFLREMREMTLRLYRMRAGEAAQFYVDKSPRYHVIAAEIMGLFPTGQFVFLWRNPLGVVSSMIETWGAGRWNVYEFEFDLYSGLAGLVSARQQAGTRACSIQFESIVGDSRDAIERVFQYLGLDFDAERTRRFSEVSIVGRMQDPTGTKLYSRVSQEPLARWKATLASPVRKWWCRRYLKWIGRTRLNVMGYDLDHILAELDSIPNRYATAPMDVIRMIFGLAVRTFEPWIMRDKLRRIARGERLYFMR